MCFRSGSFVRPERESVGEPRMFSANTQLEPGVFVSPSDTRVGLSINVIVVRSSSNLCQSCPTTMPSARNRVPRDWKVPELMRCNTELDHGEYSHKENGRTRCLQLKINWIDVSLFAKNYLSLINTLLSNCHRISLSLRDQ